MAAASRRPRTGLFKSAPGPRAESGGRRATGRAGQAAVPSAGVEGAGRAPAPLASRSRSSSGARAAASSATAASPGAVTSRPPPNRRARPRSPAWARTRAHGLGQMGSAGGRGPAQRSGLKLQRLAGAARGAPELVRLPAWTAGHGGAESSAGGARVPERVRGVLRVLRSGPGQVLRRQAGPAVNSRGESLVKDERLASREGVRRQSLQRCVATDGRNAAPRSG